MALLFGPPELCNFAPLNNTATGNTAPNNTATGNEFLDMLRSGMALSNTSRTQMGRTENFSPTFLSSGDACLDFFFQVVPDTHPESVIQLLEAAWKQNPLTALKLVCQLRGVRGTGKSDREGFYAAACWMHSHHPKTLAANVAALGEFGYLKDLPEILLRLLQGPENINERRADRAAHKKKIQLAKSKQKSGQRRSFPGYFARKGAAARQAKSLGTLKPREDRIAADISKGMLMH